MYLSISFDTNLDFIQNEYRIFHKGFIYEIVRGKDNFGHILYVESSRDEVYNSVLEFFSELCWLFNTRLLVLGKIGAGVKTPFYCQRELLGGIVNGINLDEYIPYEYNDQQILALAIYREAKNSNSVFYQFLNYFKIINMINPKGKDQKEWINRNINSIKLTEEENKRLQSIINLGEYLYSCGRCAIAHASYANNDKIANPDNYYDYEMICEMLQIIEKFAVYIMINEMDIKTLEELKNNKNLILIKKIIDGEFQLMNIELNFYNNKESFTFFQKIPFEIIKKDSNYYLLNTKRDFRKMFISFALKIDEPKIEIVDLGLNENETEITEQIQFWKFLRNLYQNGAIEIIENGVMIYRLDYFLPINIDPTKTFEAIDKKIHDLEQKLL